MLRLLKIAALSLALMGSTGPAAFAQFEAPRAVSAVDFLGPQFMQSDLHKVAPEAWNDGHANTYRIETPSHTFEARGTEQARQLIHEIHITDELRSRSTPGAALGAAKNRAVNLVETPIRVADTVIDRGSAISNVGDAILFIPKGAFDITETLLEGVGEFGVTGVRLVKGAAGTKCSGFGCVEKAGADIWSGVNSLAGKHNAARELYAEFGIDPHTENKILRRQVDRLAYADAYTSTALKFGISDAGIKYLSDYNRGVGYFNNAEFVGIYEDAHRQRNREKEVLTRWGVDIRAVETLYANKAFTHKSRTDLVEALSHIKSEPARARLAHAAADSQTRYDAVSVLKSYQYLAQLSARGQLAGFYTDYNSAIAVSQSGALIVPVVADYLQLTPNAANTLQNIAAIERPAEFHIIGAASPEFSRQAAQFGMNVIPAR